MLAKARLVQIKWDAEQEQAEPVDGGKTVEVQFNPETLKLTYANENKGGDQPGGSAAQFVGSSKSKLSVELLFDTSATGADVRRSTEKVGFFIKAEPQADQNNKRVPPGVSFEWGSFIFRGVVESMDESLDYFSEDGVPLRAAVSLQISRQDIEFIIREGAGADRTPGTTPLQPARPGDSVQRMAGREGKSGDWKSIAAANDIDDPLRVPAGSFLDMNAAASASASLGAGAGISAQAGIGAGASGRAGFSAGIGGGVGFSGGASLGANAGIGAGAGISASGGASAAFGAGAGASAGVSAGIGGSASISGSGGVASGGALGGSVSAAGAPGINAGAGVTAGGGFGAGVDVAEE